MANSKPTCEQALHLRVCEKSRDSTTRKETRSLAARFARNKWRACSQADDKLWFVPLEQGLSRVSVYCSLYVQKNEFIHFRYILKTIAHNCCCFYTCALTSFSSVVVIFENAHRLRLRFHYLFFRINEFDHTSLPIIAAFGGGNPGTQQTPRSQTVRIFLGSLLTTCFPKRNIWPSLRRGKEGPLVPEEFKEGVRLVWI